MFYDVFASIRTGPKMQATMATHSGNNKNLIV